MPKEARTTLIAPSLPRALRREQSSLPDRNRRLSGECRLKTLIVGDSHASFCFDLIDGCDVRWLGSVTMFRIGRDGFDGFLDQSQTYDAVIFVFGEIDVRAHVLRIAAQQSKPVSDVVDALASAYVNRIRDLDGVAIKVIASVVPPVNTGYAARNIAVPVVGTIEQRSEAVSLLNARLQMLSARSGIGYLDIYSAFVGRDGCIPLSKSDYVCHIDPYRSKPIVAALRILVPGEFRYDSRRRISALGSFGKASEDFPFRQRIRFRRVCWKKKCHILIQSLNSKIVGLFPRASP